MLTMDIFMPVAICPQRLLLKEPILVLIYCHVCITSLCPLCIRLIYCLVCPWLFISHMHLNWIWSLFHLFLHVHLILARLLSLCPSLCLLYSFKLMPMWHCPCLSYVYCHALPHLSYAYCYYPSQFHTTAFALFSTCTWHDMPPYAMIWLIHICSLIYIYYVAHFYLIPLLMCLCCDSCPSIRFRVPLMWFPLLPMHMWSSTHSHILFNVPYVLLI